MSFSNIPNCPECGGDNLDVLPGGGLIQAVETNVLTNHKKPSEHGILVTLVICNNCGYIRLYSSGITG